MIVNIHVNERTVNLPFMFLPPSQTHMIRPLKMSSARLKTFLTVKMKLIPSRNNVQQISVMNAQGVNSKSGYKN